MTIFLFSCIALLLFSGLFYLFPRTRSGGAEQDLSQANLEWYRLRTEELAGEQDELQEDARLRLLEDEVNRGPIEAEEGGVSRFPVWLLMPLVALFSAVLYYYLGAAPDVQIVRQMQAMDESTTAADRRRLIVDIEERSAQRPDNLHYKVLLGQFYMGEQDYAQAARTYGELAVAAPEDAQVLAYAAQAEYLAAGRTLTDKARLRAEQALAVSPHQRTALGLLGMASFEQQQYRAAIEYWQRLLVIEPPGSESARMIAEVIETARQQLGDADTTEDTGVIAATQGVPAVEGVGVTVQVSAPAGAEISDGDTVFVLARNADSDSRMPIAVERLSAARLPVTLRLDDSNSMAGQKISSVPAVVVAVQVSPKGQPGESNATWLGEVGPVKPSVDGKPLDILLRAN